jgi:hypothetical protein
MAQQPYYGPYGDVESCHPYFHILYDSLDRVISEAYLSF